MWRLCCPLFLIFPSFCTSGRLSFELWRSWVSSHIFYSKMHHLFFFFMIGVCLSVYRQLNNVGDSLKTNSKFCIFRSFTLKLRMYLEGKMKPCTNIIEDTQEIPQTRRTALPRHQKEERLGTNNGKTYVTNDTMDAHTTARYRLIKNAYWVRGKDTHVFFLISI